MSGVNEQVLPEVLHYGEMNSLKEEIDKLKTRLERLNLDPEADPKEIVSVESELSKKTDLLIRLKESIESGETKLEGVSLMQPPVSRSIEEVSKIQETVTSIQTPEKQGIGLPLMVGAAVGLGIYYLM